MMRLGSVAVVMWYSPIQSHAHTDILQSHRGANLPDAFANILNEFGISDNVSDNSHTIMK
jgi:hypothetical protein